MSKDNIIINIYHNTVFYPDDTEDILEQFEGIKQRSQYRYCYIPAVVCEKRIYGQVQKPDSFYIERSFSLHESGTLLSLLERYFGPDFKKSELTSIRKAFQMLANLALPCADRVIADLCCQIIIESVAKYPTHKGKFIFFIERAATDKMLGRLGTLYLNLDNVIICFLSYLPRDLMTTTMSSQTGKLYFDLHRLLITESCGKIGPYPGASEDSLIQSFFYNPLPPGTGKELLPIRFDVFAQGLPDSEIEAKSEYVSKILEDSNETVPYPIGNKFVLLPDGFINAKAAWKDHFEKDVKEMLRNEWRF